MSKHYNGSSQFNCGMMVTFPKVYVMNTESPTLAELIQLWYDSHVPESLRREHTVCSLINCGSRVVFLKVYISSMEGLPHLAYYY